jgi:hypothetical protein
MTMKRMSRSRQKLGGLDRAALGDRQCPGGAVVPKQQRAQMDED